MSSRTRDVNCPQRDSNDGNQPQNVHKEALNNYKNNAKPEQRDEVSTKTHRIIIKGQDGVFLCLFQCRGPLTCPADFGDPQTQSLNSY